MLQSEIEQPGYLQVFKLRRKAGQLSGDSNTLSMRRLQLLPQIRLIGTAGGQISRSRAGHGVDVAVLPPERQHLGAQGGGVGLALLQLLPAAGLQIAVSSGQSVQLGLQLAGDRVVVALQPLEAFPLLGDLVLQAGHLGAALVMLRGQGLQLRLAARMCRALLGDLQRMSACRAWMLSAGGRAMPDA